MQERRSQAGFTLVELIVVIAIIGVLVAILAPQFTRYIESSRATTCSVDIASLWRDYTLRSAFGSSGEFTNMMKETLKDNGVKEADIIAVGSDGFDIGDGICPSGSIVHVKVNNQSGLIETFRCEKHGGSGLRVATASDILKLQEAFAASIATMQAATEDKMKWNGTGYIDSRGQNRTKTVEAALNALGLSTGPNSMWKIKYESDLKYCIYSVDFTAEQAEKMKTNPESVGTITGKQIYIKNGELFLEQDAGISFKNHPTGGYAMISNEPQNTEWKKP